MNTSTAVDKILPKLALVKAKLQAVTKGANNPFFKSKYADLNTYLEAVEPLLEDNKMILLQPISETTANNVVESIIFDVESGQYVKSSMKLVGESDMQKAGSAVTYARRYTLGALLSMKAEDDDGNNASNKGPQPLKTQATKASTTYTLKPTANVVPTTAATGTATEMTKPAPATVAAQQAPPRPSFRKPAAKAETPAAPTVNYGTVEVEDDI